jgi:hypothetical protein
MEPHYAKSETTLAMKEGVNASQNIPLWAGRPENADLFMTMTVNSQNSRPFLSIGIGNKGSSRMYHSVGEVHWHNGCVERFSSEGCGVYGVYHSGDAPFSLTTPFSKVSCKIRRFARNTWIRRSV